MAEPQLSTQSAPDLVVEAIALVKKFGSTVAVDGVSLEARAGESLCVIGPNGAGKTTLLLLLGGVLLPSAGHVRVFGLHRWKDNFDIRTRSTFLTAEPIFGASPTPYEFLRFFAQIYRLPKPVFLERAQRLVDEMQMEPHLDKPWHRLSLGMKKKVGLIAAFLPDAGLRIMDEPFAGGVDPLGMERLYEWIDAAKNRGETILLSTQVLEQAESCSDRLFVLTKGSIAASGPPADVIRHAGIDPAEPRALSKAFMRLTSA